MNAYDFDQTIYAGESSLEFILFYIKKDPQIIKFMPSVFKAVILYEMAKITFDDFTKKYAPALEQYFKENEVYAEQAVAEFWDKHEKKIKPFYRKIQREDDVIITASPEFMMHDICDRLGIKNLVATDFDIKTGEIKSACFREGKIDCFRKAFPDGVIDDFYTDSINDEFLFPYAKRVFFVKGNKIKRIK